MSETPKLLDENAPVVTMDIELGQRLKPGEVINFDYDTFDQTAREMGATPKDIGNLKVDIVDPKYRPDTAGQYLAARNESESPYAEVTFKPSRVRGNRLSKTLVHETQHYVDDIKGTVTKRDPETYSEALRTAKKSKLLLYAGGLGTAASVGLSLKAGLMVSIPSLMAGFGNVARFGGYYNDPTEVSARKAEKQYGDKEIISVDR